MESQGVKSHCLRIQLWETDSKSRVTEFPVMAKVSDIQSSTQKLQQFKPILLNTTLTASEIKEFSQKPLKKKQTLHLCIAFLQYRKHTARLAANQSLQNSNRSALFNCCFRVLFFLPQQYIALNKAERREKSLCLIYNVMYLQQEYNIQACWGFLITDLGVHVRAGSCMECCRAAHVTALHPESSPHSATQEMAPV